MKVRKNKRRILINLRHNKQYDWWVWTYVVKAHKIKERNERIKKLVDML